MDPALNNPQGQTPIAPPEPVMPPGGLPTVSNTSAQSGPSEGAMANPNSLRASGPVEVPVDAAPFQALIPKFEDERRESAKIFQKSRKAEEAVTKNYECDQETGGATSQGIYPGFFGVANCLMADMQGLVAPPGETVQFDLRVFGADGMDDFNKKQGIAAEIYRLLRLADWDRLRLGDVRNYFFHGNSYLVGPIKNERSCESWTVKEVKKDQNVMVRAKTAIKGTQPLEFEQPDPRVCFPDPSVRDRRDIQWFHHRRVIPLEELRRIMMSALDEADGYVLEEIKAVLTENATWESLGSWDTQANERGSIQVWERLGFLSSEMLDMMTTALNRDPQTARLEPGLCYRVWYTNRKRVLRVSAVKVNPTKVPVIWSVACPYPSKELVGMPIGESLVRLWDMLTKIHRSIEDQLRDTSAVHAVIDPSRVHNTNFALIGGRQVWLSRRDPLDIEGKFAGRPPVEFLQIPSRIAELMQLLAAYESKVNTVTGVPQLAQNPAEMGSGIRTTGQMTMIWKGAAKVIRWFVASVDKTCDEPVIDAILDWIGYTNPSLLQDVNRVEIEAMGVMGALQREVIPQQLLETMGSISAVPAVNEWVSEPDIARAIVSNIMPRGVKTIKTPDEYAEAKALELKLQQERDKIQGQTKAAGDLDVERVRAASSARDTMAGVAREAMKNPDMIDILPATLDQVFKHTGTMNPRIEAGLAALQQRVMRNQMQNGIQLTPEQQAAQQAPFAPLNPGQAEGGVMEQPDTQPIADGPAPMAPMAPITGAPGPEASSLPPGPASDLASALPGM